MRSNSLARSRRPSGTVLLFPWCLMNLSTTLGSSSAKRESSKNGPSRVVEMDSRPADCDSLFGSQLLFYRKKKKVNDYHQEYIVCDHNLNKTSLQIKYWDKTLIQFLQLYIILLEKNWNLKQYIQIIYCAHTIDTIRLQIGLEELILMSVSKTKDSRTLMYVDDVTLQLLMAVLRPCRRGLKTCKKRGQQ